MKPSATTHHVRAGSPLSPNVSVISKVWLAGRMILDTEIREEEAL